jgi:hypothetical protein
MLGVCVCVCVFGQRNGIPVVRAKKTVVLALDLFCLSLLVVVFLQLETHAMLCMHQHVREKISRNACRLGWAKEAHQYVFRRGQKETNNFAKVEQLCQSRAAKNRVSAPLLPNVLETRSHKRQNKKQSPTGRNITTMLFLRSHRKFVPGCLMMLAQHWPASDATLF